MSRSKKEQPKDGGPRYGEKTNYCEIDLHERCIHGPIVVQEAWATAGDPEPYPGAPRIKIWTCGCSCRTK